MSPPSPLPLSTFFFLILQHLWMTLKSFLSPHKTTEFFHVWITFSIGAASWYQQKTGPLLFPLNSFISHSFFVFLWSFVVILKCLYTIPDEYCWHWAVQLKGLLMTVPPSQCMNLDQQFLNDFCGGRFVLYNLILYNRKILSADIFYLKVKWPHGPLWMVHCHRPQFRNHWYRSFNPTYRQFVCLIIHSVPNNIG